MSKRHISPGIQPPPKRPHSDHPTTAPYSKSPTSFDQLWDEIVLVIFSHLSYKDLCRVQATSQNWSRLALDNQLWKKLYFNEYGKGRLRGGRGFVGRQDGREVKPLPGRARVDHDQDARDWKWMFRISSNWRTGRCTVEQWRRPLLSPSEPSGAYPEPRTCVLLAGSLTITSAITDGHPSLLLISPDRSEHILSCRTRRSNADTTVNTLVLDQSPPTNAHKFRVVAFLSTSEFLIFSIDHHHPSRSALLISYLPVIQVPRLTNVFHAVFHEHLLVSLSHSFNLSIYDLSSGTIVHTQTLSSFSCYPPSSLVLTPLTSSSLARSQSLSSSTSLNSPSSYKLVISYAVPIYPAHWSVGATELIISRELFGMSVTSTRTIRAFDIPSGWFDAHKLAAMKAQWDRKVRGVADTQTDGKWVVLAPGEDPPGLASESDDDGEDSRRGSTGTDMARRITTHSSASMHSPTTLQLYRLSFPTSSTASPGSPSSTSQPKLNFVRMLHGHVGPVSALALADGRCVSLGVNGNIWVWDLEGGDGASIGTEVEQTIVDRPDGSEEEEGRVVRVSKGTVVFDERRIVSAGRNGVEVRRFDV